MTSRGGAELNEEEIGGLKGKMMSRGGGRAEKKPDRQLGDQATLTRPDERHGSDRE